MTFIRSDYMEIRDMMNVMTLSDCPDNFKQQIISSSFGGKVTSLLINLIKDIENSEEGQLMTFPLQGNIMIDVIRENWDLKVMVTFVPTEETYKRKSSHELMKEVMDL